MTLRFLVLFVSLLTCSVMAACSSCEEPKPIISCDCSGSTTGDTCFDGEGVCRAGLCYVWTPKDGECRALALEATCLNAPLFYCDPI